MAQAFDPKRSPSPPLTHLFTSALTLSRHFNEATYSDLTIKFSGREIKCHKMILCDGSDYFKALCGPHSRFSEAHSSVIELREDAPVAVEAVFRSIYGFKYQDIEDCCSPFKAQDHIDVITAAQKYLLPGLEMQAITGLETAIAMTEADLIASGDADKMVDLIILLTEQAGFSDVFRDTAPDLVRSYMSQLWKMKRFRSWLETDDGGHAFDLATQAISWGSKVIGAADHGKVKPSRVARCPEPKCKAVLSELRNRSADGEVMWCHVCNLQGTWADVDLMVVVGKACKEEQGLLKVYD